jgi:hypothetical protein
VVERIILLKLHESSERAQVGQRLQAALLDLPGLEDVSVGLPADAPSSKSWDLSVILEFASEAAQNLVLADAPFRTLMEQELAPKFQVVKAWSFERLL